MPSIEHAKCALDDLIRKSRAHLYKPIQIAEILYRDRVYQDINLLNLEDYRTKSKKWRDDICIELVGRKCSSSARFQDDLFNNTAIPPQTLHILGQENRRTNGAVEAYIYKRFIQKYTQISTTLNYCLTATQENFNVKSVIDSFWQEPGLKRSLDKIYEIIVYALFSALVEALELRVEVSIDLAKRELLKEFEDFARSVMCLDFSHPCHSQDAKIFRVGVTNAADRGLDMYSNWGPAIQIKHLSLDVELAENIVTSISSDRIVIVCKDAERDVILSLLTQIGWRSHIQSIVTEDNLVEWYEKALRGTFSDDIGGKLLGYLCEELTKEFPSIDETPEALRVRQYENITDSFWR